MTEIRLGGTGGQGLILAGIILGETAVMSGLNAVQTQSYGPEARGGASKAEVIIAKNEIYYPKVTTPDILLVLSQAAYDKYSRDVDENTLIIVDESIKIRGRNKTIILPIIENTEVLLNKKIVANIVSLGVLEALTGLVPIEKLREVVSSRVPSHMIELNMKALDLGINMVKEYSKLSMGMRA